MSQYVSRMKQTLKLGEMPAGAPHICDGCEQLRSCINGKYCLRLGLYVEYYRGSVRPCGETE